MLRENSVLRSPYFQTSRPPFLEGPATSFPETGPHFSGVKEGRTLMACALLISSPTQTFWGQKAHESSYTVTTTGVGHWEEVEIPTRTHLNDGGTWQDTGA